jgi:hypothetical protein
MTVVIVADVQCTPGRRGEFVRAIAGMVRDTCEQPGFDGPSCEPGGESTDTGDRALQ